MWRGRAALVGGGGHLGLVWLGWGKAVVIGEWGMDVRMRRPKGNAVTTIAHVGDQKDFDKDALEDGVPSWASLEVAK